MLILLVFIMFVYRFDILFAPGLRGTGIAVNVLGLGTVDHEGHGLTCIVIEILHLSDVMIFGVLRQTLYMAAINRRGYGDVREAPVIVLSNENGVYCLPVVGGAFSIGRSG